MLTLLIGTDWIQNRNAMINAIAQDVHQKKGGRILIVPELISHDTERRLCQAAGDTTSRCAEVLTFTRLAKRVSDYDGCPIRPCLDNGGRLVAMASAAKQLHSKLKAYAAVETMPEFFAGLIDAMDEFKRCCITSADLMYAAGKTEGSLAQKLEELSLLLEAYDGICAHGKCDPRDQMVWLLEELEESSYGREHVFYIDGFPDFTRQHMNIIKHLAQVSADMTISLTCDQIGSDHMAFEKAGQTAAELLQFAKNVGITVQVQQIPSRKDALEPVRNYLFQGDLSQCKCNDVRVYPADSVRQECEAALETVVSLTENGARYRDINIVCADMGTYQNVLEMMFEKCNIPIYISGTEDILNEPAIATVFAALDAALGSFEQQDVFNYLKSMLSPLDTDTCDMVENYAVMWGINGTKWIQPWTNHPSGLGKDWTSGAERHLELLNQARRIAIEPLQKLSKELKASATLSEEVQALYAFLETIHYSEKLSENADILEANGRGREAQILNQLWDILVSALEQLYDTLGQTAWQAENFTRLLRLLITQYDVGTIPPVLDAISVGPTNVMRCQACEHLIVLGAEEGNLPGYAGSTGVLTDQERTALRKIGVPLTGGSMDGLLAEFADIYGVFCSADTSVTVSYCGTEPSFLYRRLQTIAGGEGSCQGCLGQALVNEAEACAFLLQKNDNVAAQQLGIRATYQEMESHRSHTIGEMSRESVEQLYGRQLKLSASQIDRLAQCRLAYFLQYGLFARERTIAQVDPAEFGTYVHAVLELTVQEVMQAGGFTEVSADEMVAIARKHSDAYAQSRFVGMDSQRMVYLFRRNWGELEQIVRELWDELHHSRFLPSGFEVAFGDGSEIPAVDVSGKDMAAKLRGFVDRVDIWKDGGKTYFRVVDYKTGRKDFDYCDVYNGYGLQMLLYLFALEDSQSELVGKESVPAGVQYFPARVPLVSADGLLSDEEAEKAREKLWKRKGLLLSNDDVLKAMEDTELPKRMPYTRKKDGSISGDLADNKQFHLLKQYVFFRVGKMVDEIASGKVSPNPYTRGAGHDACSYCPYGAICHKLTVDGRRNYRAISGEQFWEDVQKEVQNNG